MPSTVISKFTYNEEEHSLLIEFVSGSIYRYEDVPAEIAGALKTYREKGIYYNKYIKGQYDFKKIKGPGDQ